MPFPGQKLPHRTLRGLAVEKGTVQNGWDGSPQAGIDNALLNAGQAATANGYRDNGDAAREGMESAIGTLPVAVPSPFSLGTAGAKK